MCIYNSVYRQNSVSTAQTKKKKKRKKRGKKKRVEEGGGQKGKEEKAEGRRKELSTACAAHTKDEGKRIGAGGGRDENCIIQLRPS